MPQDDLDFERARVALLKSLIRLQVASRARTRRRTSGYVSRTDRPLLANLRQLFRYRALISSLVARELKARYRGSVLGFVWSFVNPLLLLLIYTFVFTVVLPGAHPPELEPYALFLFCGILPWTWFSSSLLESSNVLIAGGNLIRRCCFRRRCCRSSPCSRGSCTSASACRSSRRSSIYYRVPVCADRSALVSVDRR